jgi:hypothetical protein
MNDHTALRAVLTLTSKLLLVSILIGTISSASGFAQSDSLTSGLPTTWFNTLVSIELQDRGSWTPVGSGFFVRTEFDHTMLITAAHVIADTIGSVWKLKPNPLRFRFNIDSPNTDVVLDSELTDAAGSGWFFAGGANLDLAGRFFGFHGSRKATRIPLERFLPSEKLSPGTPIFVFGFPSGVRTEEFSLPVARSGIVSRVTPLIGDVFVFPGHSGGPVIYSPPIKVGEGLNSPFLPTEMLIGMVTANIPYQEYAYSKQTGRPRVMFEENTGLSVFVPAESIHRFITSERIRQVDGGLK